MKAVDMHCDTIAEIYEDHRLGGNANTRRNRLHMNLERMKVGDCRPQNFALYTNMGREKEPFLHTMEPLDIFYQEMEAHQDLIGIVRCYRGIEENWKAGKMSAMPTIEEGGACQGSLAALRDFYRLGVRTMTLTWNFPNELGYPNRVILEGPEAGMAKPDKENGLTGTGIVFVKEIERLGTMIDISHLNGVGIWDAFHHMKKSFVASHSNARALCGHIGNLTNEMIRALAERGGVAGVNYYATFLRSWEKGEPKRSLTSDMAAHMKYMKMVGGIRCIGLGSDFDGIMSELEMNGPDKLPHLGEAMRRERFTTSEIEAVFHGNALRVYWEILGQKAISHFDALKSYRINALTYPGFCSMISSKFMKQSFHMDNPG